MEPVMKSTIFAIVLGLSAIAHGQTTQPAKPMSPDQMLSRMLKPATEPGQPLPPPTAPPAVDKTSGRGAVAPTAPAVTVLREGTYLVDRTGRLARSADGQQMEFVFDSDGKAMK